MRIESTARIDHAFDDVLAWHRRPGALVRLSPPGLGSPEDPDVGGLEAGRRVTLRLGPPLLPVRPAWRLVHARSEEGDGVASFEDHQLGDRGPVRLWHHRHALRAAGGATDITDRIDVELKGPLAALDGEARSQIERLLTFRTAQLREDLAFHAARADRPRLRVAIAGSSGLIGTQITALLRTGGHTVVRLVRRAAGPGEIRWDPAREELDPASLEGVDAVINLAGSSIATRWTPRARRRILSSRVDSSSLLARTLARMQDGPRVLIQASAIGIYGPQRPGELLTERDDDGDGFLADVCRRWEAAALPATEAGVRTVHLRTGIVLSDAGGTLLPQLPMFLLGAGGRLAPPAAQLSWITLDDMTRAYAHALQDDALSGPVNTVAPHPATAQEFARTLGRVLHRPALVPVPAAGPALLLGPDGARELVRADQRVSDARLRDRGFTPAHPELEGALRHVLRR